MIAEFQVFYKSADSPGAPQSIVVRAERAKQALEIAQSLGLEPIGVGPERVVLDEHQHWYDRAEAGAYLRGGPAKIDEFCASGLLPKCKDGRPLFPRRLLDALAEKRMGIPQWEADATRRVA